VLHNRFKNAIVVYQSKLTKHEYLNSNIDFYCNPPWLQLLISTSHVPLRVLWQTKLTGPTTWRGQPGGASTD